MSSSFAERLRVRSSELSRTEHKVARYFSENRHQTLVQSALEIGQASGTSDATVIRTARALGFDGLDGLRKEIAREFDAGVTPADRMTRTIEANAGSLERALDKTLSAQTEALASLRRNIDTKEFNAIVQTLAQTFEISVFGLGPSASIAEYFCTQLRRLGFRSQPLTRSGFLLADELLQLKSGGVVLIMAYGRVYAELSVLLSHAQALGMETILITDSLEKELGERVDRIVKVPRGAADGFSMHSATLAFLEAVLVGLSTLVPDETLASLEQLNRLRGDLAGKASALAVRSRTDAASKS